MAYKKTHDLTVKVGEYQKDGQTKGRYERIGSIMVADDGNKMILINRTFNPAGVPNPDNKDSVLVSAFAVENNQQPTAHQTAKANAYSPADMPDDTIPF